MNASIGQNFCEDSDETARCDSNMDQELYIFDAVKCCRSVLTVAFRNRWNELFEGEPHDSLQSSKIRAKSCKVAATLSVQQQMDLTLVLKCI